MLRAGDLVDAARARGYSWYAGVPCSFLTPLINRVLGDDELEYVSAANEGDAIAIAAGAWVGGRRGVAMMQNSGLGNALSPLTSLIHTFRIPVLVICTHRGAPDAGDEPQHELMGQISGTLLDTIDVPWTRFARDSGAIERALDDAERAFTARSACALLLKRDTFAAQPLAPADPAPRRASAPVEGRGAVLARADRPARAAALKAILAAADGDGDAATVVVATTGYTGRELYALGDRPSNLYMVGSMGCASSLGLGLAMARPDLRVVVADGDGAALMRMGNLATVGAYAPANLTHVVLDNEAHDSTGAQATVSALIDFAGIATSCGYHRVLQTDSVTELEDFLAPVPCDGARFAHVKIGTGTLAHLPRPAIAPPAVLDRLMAHIGAAP